MDYNKQKFHCYRYIPMLKLVYLDEELRAWCAGHSAHKADEGHRALSAILHELMEDAYACGMVLPNFREVLYAAEITDEQAARPEKALLEKLTTEQVLAMISFHYRRDHFDEGSFINDSVANGHIFMLYAYCVGARD